MDYPTDELVSSVAFTEEKRTADTDIQLTKNILDFFKENDHYIDWRKENILNHFSDKILEETAYFDQISVQALPIDEEIQIFVTQALEENDGARKGMEQLTEQASQSRSDLLEAKAELSETKLKLQNAIDMNKALVKEKWYQKLFRSFSDYKYKYEVEGAQDKKK
ncbi:MULTISPECIES: hypothetical protein [unclassified Lactococcus]|uniref:hypothetical protein n=1 Tax=unclassified Lactococcus TaxID=2643510 RepID=UPI0011C95426|nr:MULTISPECIES: hypothetical protein [unclassified Lactococcus]MQW22316.1 hypothetical protein [Lactococcus sp. dk101]TXK45240.1 hypothetical protein FVP42_03265 [Lactococcus sp. dk310]TXK50982.1 hypothetical protein FVP43_01830 [Lactococcus sp. dk322]